MLCSPRALKFYANQMGSEPVLSECLIEFSIQINWPPSEQNAAFNNMGLILESSTGGSTFLKVKSSTTREQLSLM
jgi:hypothetical protein